MHALLNYTTAHSAWIRETIDALVRLESPSTDKTAVDICGAELAARLTALGGRVDRLVREKRGDHLQAEFGGTGPRVLLLGHFDTVWPIGQLARMPLHEKDGRLYGPGVFDMKAGIAMAMLATRAVHEIAPESAPRIVMLWTTDEEIGSVSSRAAIEEEARRSDAVLVLEPALPGGGVKTRRKGCGDFQLIVHGVSAHAGIDPGKGASAIHELAHQIVAVQDLQNVELGISINVGVIAGGSRTNVIAEHATAGIDVRVPTTADGDRIEARLRGLTPKLKGTRLELTGGIGRPPLERSAGVVRLFELARQAARELGRDLDEGGTGGGSDGNFTAALGVPTLDGLGACGDGAHALHEHVLLDDLTWRAALVAALLIRVGGVQ